MSDELRARPALVLALLMLAASGCSTGTGGGSVHGADFPSREEVGRIQATPPPGEVFDRDLRHVSQWTLEAKPAERIEPSRWTDGSDWGELLAELVESTEGRVVPTRAMHCVARELARFGLEHRGRPDHSLQRFIIAACNASVPDVAFRSLQGEVRPSEDEDDIFARWQEEVAATVRQAVRSQGRAVVGIGFARVAGRAGVYVAVGEPLVEIEPVATTLSRDAVLELRGRILGPAESVAAAVNHGRYGVEPCEVVGSPRPPEFHFACAADSADESAWASLSFTRPDRLLGEHALSALVWLRDDEARVYRRALYTTPRPVTDASLFAPAFVEDLNGVRSRAGLKPVTLEQSQSATATLVAPHFFAAMTSGGHDDVVDKVALGLMAGWDVDGMIRTGSFAFGAVPQSRDLAELLVTTLEEPMSRGVLLDPNIGHIAVGPIVAEPNGVPVLAAVVTTYTLFEDGSQTSDADALLARLTEARHQRELPPPYRIVEVSTDAMHAAGRVGRGANPQFVLDELLQKSVTVLARQVRGWYGETSELDEFEFPEEILAAPRLGAAIGVAHRKEADDAWGRYVVVIVSTER